MQVHYTEEADADLNDVASYTYEVWGAEQRDYYVGVLETVCEQILPVHWRHAADASSLRPGLRRWRVEKHVVFFRLVEDGLEIVRVLHERQLPAKHFE